MKIISICAMLLAAIIPSQADGRRGIILLVDTFIARRDKCDHFRSEDGYNAARYHFIAAQVQRYCTGTDRQLKILRTRLAKRPALLAKLADYEDVIE